MFQQIIDFAICDGERLPRIGRTAEKTEGELSASRFITQKQQPIWFSEFVKR
jgi:hypothetical protein